MAALEDNDFLWGGPAASMLLDATGVSSQRNLLLRSFEFPYGGGESFYGYRFSLVNAYDRAFPLQLPTFRNGKKSALIN